tara:strand:+ start:39 stop:536 length:498 start_codon:yes stop_codon:yes gene_type:complete
MGKRILIEDYIKLPQEERQKHLRLNEEDCIEIGGNSTQFKSLLAHTLNTTIPNGRKENVLLCHACNNGKCSNPYHHYWGTARENILDSGTFHDRRKAKAAREGKDITEQYSISSKKGVETCKEKYGDNFHSKINNRKGTTKSEEHKRNISLAVTKWHEKRKQNNG